jgi:hypothetical protein
MSRTNTRKLRDLRTKTDLELVHLIRNRLEQGVGDERARREVLAWLPLLAEPDRAALLAEWDKRAVCVVCQAAGA